MHYFYEDFANLTQKHWDAGKMHDTIILYYNNQSMALYLR